MDDRRVDADLLDTYVATCQDVVPPSCDGYCDGLLSCYELPPEPDNLAGCQFECLLYEGYASLTGTPACDAATAGLLECVAKAECPEMEIVGCDDEILEHSRVCELV